MSKYSPASWKKEACYLLLFHSLLKQDGNFPSTWKSALTEIKISCLWQVTRSTAFWTEPAKSCNFRQHVGSHPCLWVGNWPVWPEVEPPFWFTEGSLRTSFFGSSIPGGFKLVEEAVSENITLFVKFSSSNSRLCPGGQNMLVCDCGYVPALLIAAVFKHILGLILTVWC